MTHNPRTFLFGAIAGIAITIGAFVLVSEIAGIKWQPVSYPSPDQLYGCTVKQQMQNGDCP